MATHEFESLHLVRELHDDKLIERLKNVLSRQRGLTAEMICHLCEVEVRGIHARLGYASMHEYCVDGLHMSKEPA